MSRDGPRPNRREFLQHSAGAAGLTSLLSVRSILGMKPYVSEQWNRTFERSPSQDSNGMVRTQDGNFVVASFTEVGGLAVWLAKFRPDGSKLWDQRIGSVDGVATEVPWDIAEAGDGSLFLATDGDGWNVLKTTPDGDPLWVREWLPEAENVTYWHSPLQVAGTDSGGCVVAGGVNRETEQRGTEPGIVATRYGTAGEFRWQQIANTDNYDIQTVDITLDDAVYVASNPEYSFRVDAFTSEGSTNQLNVNLLEDSQGLRYTGGIYTDAIRLSDGGYVVSVAGAGGTRFDSEGQVLWNTIIDIGDPYNDNRGRSISLKENGYVATVGKIRRKATRPGWMVVMDVDDGSVEAVHRFRDVDGGDKYRKAQQVVPTEDGFAVSGLQGRDWGTNTRLWVGSVDIEQDNTPDLVPTLAGLGAVGAGGWAVKKWQTEDEGEDDESSSGWHDRIS